MKLRKIAAVGAATAVLVGGSMTAAFAATTGADDTNVTVTASDLSITTPAAGDFTAVTLDGNAQTRHATLATFDAIDARGTGAGWKVSLQGSQFAEWGDIDGAGTGTAIGYVTGGKTLPANSMLMGVPTVAKKDSTSSDVPTISITSATAIDTGLSAVQIANATGPAGMGSYTFTQGDADSGVNGDQNLKLTVRADAYAKNYRSDVTVSIVSGP